MKKNNAHAREIWHSKQQIICVAVFAFIIILLMFSFSIEANAAEKFRDNSLSVEQTMREPSITRSVQGDTWNDPKIAQQLRESRNSATATAPLANEEEIGASPAASGEFMNKFCSDTSQSLHCRKTHREEICARFKRSAINVQQILDRVVACEANAEKGVEGDCDGLDAGRIDLLKQYWQDEDMSYSILFLPDMVLNASAPCSGIKAGTGR